MVSARLTRPEASGERLLHASGLPFTPNSAVPSLPPPPGHRDGRRVSHSLAFPDPSVSWAEKEYTQIRVERDKPTARAGSCRFKALFHLHVEIWSRRGIGASLLKERPGGTVGGWTVSRRCCTF